MEMGARGDSGSKSRCSDEDQPPDTGSDKEEEEGEEDGEEAKGPRDVIDVSWAIGNFSFFFLISFYVTNNFFQPSANPPASIYVNSS
jgi:hypothetical protein